MSEQDRAEGGPPTITVRVFAPNETDPREFTFEKTMKVGDAAGEAATQFGYQAQLPSFQNKDDRVLDRDKPLVAEGIQDNEELELVDVGGGV